MAKLSVELKRYFFEEERQPKVKLANILSLAGERTFGFLLIVLSLPSALPVPAPGYSIPFAIVIFLLAIQLIAGSKSLWLPQGISNSAIELEMAQSVVKAGIPWLRRIEAITRPRLLFVCTTLPGRAIIGSAIVLMSISMMIPIPLTNTLPAMGIFITAFGLLEDDGLICLVGLFFCVLGATLTTSILIFGVAAVKEIIKYIFETFLSK